MLPWKLLKFTLWFPEVLNTYMLLLLTVIKWIQYAENRWDNYKQNHQLQSSILMWQQLNHLLLPNSQGISECKATVGVNKMFCCLVACVGQRIENSLSPIRNWTSYHQILYFHALQLSQRDSKLSWAMARCIYNTHSPYS